MKTKSLLALFTSLTFVSIRCEDILGDRAREALKLQQLIRDEVVVLLDDDSDETDYVTKPGRNKLNSLGESRKPREIDTSPGKTTNSHLQRNYQYGLTPHVSFDDNPKITRMNEFGSTFGRNAREPTEIYSYPSTYSASYSSPYSGGNRMYSGSYGSGGRRAFGLLGGGLISRGIQRLGAIKDRFRGGSSGYGGGGGSLGYSGGGRFGLSGLGSGLGIGGLTSRLGLGGGSSGDDLLGNIGLGGGRGNYRLGSGLASAFGLGGDSGGLSYNIGTNSRPGGEYYESYSDYPSGGGQVNINTTPGGQSSRYRLQASPSTQEYVSETPIGRGSTLNIIPGGTPTSSSGRYGLQYTPQSGSRQYQTSYPSTMSSDDSDETHYELMFLRNRPNQTTQTNTNDIQLQSSAPSGGSRSTVTTTGRTSSTDSIPNTQGVQEYRVVLVNDTPSSTGQASVSTSITPGTSTTATTGTSWSVGGGSTSRPGFQITTPITGTNLQVGIPSSLGSTVAQASTTTPTARSTSTGERIIKVIPVTS